MSRENDLEEARPENQRKAGAQTGGGIVQFNDARLTRFFEIVQPILTGLVLAGILYFANKVGDIGDTLIETNKQIAVMVEQNKMLSDGYKDHENRIRDLEGRKFRGVPGYGEPASEH